MLNLVETIPQPSKRTIIWVKSQIHTDNEARSIIQLSPLLRTDEELLFCPQFSTTQNNTHKVQTNNFLDHPYTVKKLTHIASYSILTRKKNETLYTCQAHLSATLFV